MEDNTVYILDSYGLIFRCYFAFISHPLTNQNGENVSALFGFFRNLHFIFKHYNPSCLIAAMDSKTKTFRHQMYDQYKATRPKTPEDLHAQVPWICDILTALGVPVLQCDGYEADDIIATVAKKCRETGRNCRILSGDKDLMQLVCDTTYILKPETGGNTWKVTTSEGVEAEWGVKPPQLLDLLSLYGDSADNIPGVKGIGVKTASKLLGEYQNLEGIYEHISEIKGAVQTKLSDGKESAFFSRELVKLCDTVPCSGIDSALSKTLNFNFSAAADILKKFGVPSVAKQYAELSVENKEGEVSPSLPSQAAARIDTASSADSLRFVDLSATLSSGAKNLSEQPRNAPAFSEQQEISVKQNDTSNYKAITKLSELSSFVDEALKSPLIAYDSETDSLDTLNAKLLGFSLCTKAGNAVYVPVQNDQADLFSQTDYISLNDCLSQISRLFSSQATVAMHNAKFDLKVLVSNLLRSKITDAQKTANQILKSKIHDTMIFAWLENPERSSKTGYSLETLGENVLGLKGIEFSQIVEKGKTFADVPLEKATPYAAEDADFTLMLAERQKKILEQNSDIAELFALEMNVLPLLAKMELMGIHLQKESLQSYDKELTLGIQAAEKSIYKEVGHEFNIASPKQLQTVLFEERKLKPGKKTKTGYSTDTNVLEELAFYDDVPRMILEYREMAKLKSTYVETLPKLADSNSRIHPDFVQTGTATGRLSCRDPNLQNIPVRSDSGRRIRSAFTAPQGSVLISADYSQIELVVLAHLSQDVNMCKAFNDGTDVHKATAALIYGVSPEQVTSEMRRTAKTINFGVIYGMSAFRLARDLGISRTEAANFIENYFKTYKNIDSFIKQTVQNAEESGYVETIFHRRRPVYAINSANKMERAGAERIAVNSPVQGSAADIVKKAMVNVAAELEKTNSPAKLLLQVHDELIFECPDDKKIIDDTIALIKQQMENAVKLNVPLRVSIEYGKNWGEFH